MLYTAAAWRRHVGNDAHSEALRLASQAVAIQARLMAEGREFVARLARLPAVQRGDQAKCEEILGAYRLEFPRYRDVGVIGPDGRVLCSIQSHPDSISYSDRPSFQHAVTRREFAAGNYELDRRFGTVAAHLIYPVLGSDNRVQAAVFATLDLTWVRTFAAEAHLPPGTAVTLFDQDGTVLSRQPTPQAFVGQSVLDSPIYQAIRTRQEGTIETVDLDGTRTFFGFRPLLASSGTGYSGKIYIAIGIPTAAAFAPANDILLRNLGMLGLAAALAVVAAWVGSDVLVLHRVRALARATKRLSGGDLSARSQIPYGGGEMGDLASAFDEMAARLESKQEEILRQNQALVDMERRFRGLIENSSDGIAVFGANKRLLYASPGITRILGYGVDEMASRNIFDLVAREDRDALVTYFRRVLQQPAEVLTAQLRVRHKSGGLRWVEVAVSNRLADPGVQGLVANYRDITDRKGAEEELRRANEELEIRVRERTADLARANEALRNELCQRERTQETLKKLSRAIEQTTDSVSITNRNGLIEYVNPAFEVLTGYTREEAVGQTRRILRSGDHESEFYGTLWKKILAGEVFQAVFNNRRKNGELYCEEEAITPLRDEGGAVTHFVSTGRDITLHRRTAEALRRLNDRFEKEAARVAQLLHDEAGQFLASAHITVTMLARELPPAAAMRLQEVQHALERVEEQLRRLSHELHPQILDELGLFGTLEFLAEGVTKRTGIQVTVRAESDEALPAMTRTVLYRFAQEALTNVTKHAQANRVTVLLERADGNIRCSIQDDGLGFDVPATLARRGETHLGLTGIRDRVEALGGMLHVSSGPSRGTELVVVIPLESTDATPSPHG
ncbi:MAG: PAS domain S-box protein [candidate division NC10 bacterium]|nr:PAS domain S-box protein [candidate division NC10 bacterium]